MTLNPPDNAPAPLAARLRRTGGHAGLPLVLVLIDLASKVAAYSLLPLEKPSIGISNALFLYLTINETGVGAPQRAMYDAFPSTGFVVGIAFLTESAVVLALSRTRIRTLFQILIGVGSWLALMLGAIVCCLLIHLDYSNPYASHLFYGCGNLALAAVLLSVSKTTYFKVCFSFWVAGAVGNILSYFYPPFGIVDFIYMPWLRFLLGGDIYNLADLYVLACCIMLPAAPGRFLALRLFARLRMRDAPANPA